MPEGHTVHRIARDHSKTFLGRALEVSSPQGRFADGAGELSGRVLKAVEAHGKHLIYSWSGGKRLHIHLGLYGKFRTHNSPPPAPQGQVRLRVVGDEKSFDLRGPNTCRLVSPGELRSLKKRLGPDPLRADADLNAARARVLGSRAAIGALLLNQSVIAGLGNIYRCEILFLLGVHPSKPGRELSDQQFDELWSLSKNLLQIGVRYNRIIIADPTEAGKPRSRMNRAERLLLYKQKNCSRCDSEIESWELGGRTIYACPSCQA